MMSFGKRYLLVIMLSLPVAAFSQKDSLIHKLDSLNRRKDTTGKPINNINPKAYTETTQINFNTYFILLGSDLKQEFTKPFRLTKKDWRNFGIFTGAIVALSFADEPIQQSALKLRNRNTPINNVSKYVTNFGGLYEAYTLAAFGAYGFIFKSEKMKTTTLLATQAYITGGALETVLKFLSGRTRPSYYAANVEAEPRFLGPFPKKTKGVSRSNLTSSFPSGHTTVAFAAATVFASEYKNMPIVPIIAYSAATLIGMSRITENKHWTTDVAVGAAIGFLAGKNVVNNYHRYAKIKSANAKKNWVSFSLNYSYGHFEPGLIYKFH